MSFILNAGEFDLGAGFIGRGTILAGETYAVGTSTTGVQGLLNTSGLEGITRSTVTSNNTNSTTRASLILFRSSDDSLTNTIEITSDQAFIYWQTLTTNGLSSSARFHLSVNNTRDYPSSVSCR